MKYHFFIALLFVNLLTGCTPESVTRPSNGNGEPADPFEVNCELSPGINLGNALEAPNEGDWRVTIQDDYLTIIKEAGFGSVRIPIRWSAHTAVDSPYAIDYLFVNRVQHVVDLALANDLYAVINIHHYTEMAEHPGAHRERFLALWQQISTFFQGYPTSLIFEIFNEPHDQFTADLWNEYFPQAIDIIRQTNPDRTLMIGTAGWGGIGTLNNLAIPEDEQNLIVSIHYYEPFHFTHQGAEWSEGSEEWLGTTWSAAPQELARLQDDFDQIEVWARAHNRPIYIGEFGAYHKADMYSRHLWTGNVVSQCRQRDFSWAYWEFCSGFGAWDPESESWYPLLLEALIQD